VPDRHPRQPPANPFSLCVTLAPKAATTDRASGTACFFPVREEDRNFGSFLPTFISLIPSKIDFFLEPETFSARFPGNAAFQLDAN